MFENERNEISLKDALHQLPPNKQFRGGFWKAGKNIALAGYIDRSDAISYINSAVKIEAVGGFPNFPALYGLELTMKDSSLFKIISIEFDERSFIP